MRFRSSGAIYQVKYLALTLCQILYAMLKHVFLNRLLICSRVFISIILYLFVIIILFHFFNLLTFNLFINFYCKSFYLLVNFIHF